MATWVSRIEQGFKNLVGFQPCLPQRGPYEASEGIYPVMGNEKMGEGMGIVIIDTVFPFLIISQPKGSTLPITQSLYQVAEKRPSAAFPSSFVIAAYRKVRLIPQDFGRLASDHF